MSYTYAILELSPEAYAEISEKLREGGYEHAFQTGPGGETIDMSGIALKGGGPSRPAPVVRGAKAPDESRSKARVDLFGRAIDRLKLNESSPQFETDVTRPVKSFGVRDVLDKLQPIRDSDDYAPRDDKTVQHVGVRVAIRNDDGQILALDRDDGEGPNLPGGPVRDGETAKEAAIRIMGDQVGLETDDVIYVHYGMGDKYYQCSVFSVLTDNGVEITAEDGVNAKFTDVSDVLYGEWGLFALDAFNAAGWMKRPRLNLEKLYKVCRKAVNQGSEQAGEGVDMVIDEVVLLQDLGKIRAIDDLIAAVDVSRLHADVADAFFAVVEPIEGLQNKKRLEEKVDVLMTAVDGPRTPIRFNGHEDVRKSARKIYRKRAAEFGQMLRDGTLAEKFPGRHRGGEAIRKDIPDDFGQTPDGTSKN